MNKLSTYISRVVLSLVIIFSLIVIFSSLEIFGHRTFVVESGSMEPKIKTGSVVFDQKSSSYKVGDVITFKIAGSKDTVTHRIVQIKSDAADNTFYTVKGDANQAPDANPVAKDDVVGKVGFSIPLLGYLVSFIKTLPGLIIFIIMPATILIYQELTNINTEVANLRAAKRKVVAEAKKIEQVLEEDEVQLVQRFKAQPVSKQPPRRAGKVIVALLVAAGTYAMLIHPSGAIYNDSDDLGGITITVSPSD